MSEIVGPRPHILLHCEWSRDRELVSQMLADLGVESSLAESVQQIETVLNADQVDLILADSSGGLAPIQTLLQLLDGHPESADLPMVLLGDPNDLPLLSELTIRRFNAVLLTKPMSSNQLVAAVESGLRLRARQREVRTLLAEVSASNQQLAAANRALELRREESAEEVRRKTRFLAAISHDIRTPVNALVLSCQLLRMIGQTSPQAQIDVRDIDELTGALLTNASALVELVNDLLDIARHDQGKLEFVVSDFPLDEFLSSTTEGMRPLATQKGLELVVDSVNPGVMVRTDRVKLARVVQNLVANAIKFTDVGHVRVAAHGSISAGIRIEVADTGVGIPEALREDIFDEFAQLRNPERDRTKGTGLGLAICRRLVAAMGGTIAVDTSPRLAGSLFVVILPVSRLLLIETPTPATARVAPRPGPTWQGDILVVEDHEPSRLLLQRLLRQAGLSVRTAENGQEALRMIAQSRPDLVLMDLMMPILSGRETLQILRDQDATRDLPVIILTGDLGQNDDLALPAVGASAYLSKPVEIDAFHTLLDRFLPLPIKSG